MVILPALPCLAANTPERVPVTLTNMVTPSAIHDAANGDLPIKGRVTSSAAVDVRLRVTTSSGQTSTARVVSEKGQFVGSYPSDFQNAPSLQAGFLFIDAGVPESATPQGPFQAEATVIVRNSKQNTLPEFPSAFTNDLLDKKGQVDSKCHEWPVIRTLVNSYMKSRAAALCRVGRQDFDLARESDLRYFKDNLSLYEFDHRDRDWSHPLDHRRVG